MSYGDDGGPRLRINPRLILAAVIALFGIVAYFFQTQENPVTHERQHVSMTQDQEISLGLQAAPQMAQQMGGDVDRDDPRARFVSDIGSRLVERSEVRDSPYVGNFHFHLLRDPETVNAFALPGGQVFITRGLFDKLRTEAQLAGVLGHEIGHVINRHAAEHMAKGQLGQILTVAVGVGASDDRGGGRNAQLVAAMVNQMAQLRFSRKDESEADTYGLRIMAQAGYDPTGMLDVMRVLKKVSEGSRQPEFLSTHPLPETRLREIQQQIEQTYPDGIPPNLTQGRRINSEVERESDPSE